MLKRIAAAVITLLLNVSLLPASFTQAEGVGPPVEKQVSAPTGLAVTKHTATSITASWNPVSGAVRYRLIAATSESMSPGVGVTTTALSHTFTQLQPQTVYYLAVGAIEPNSIVSIRFSAPIRITTPALAATSAPKVSWATRTSVTAQWKAVTGATYYQMQVSASASMKNALTLTVTGTKHTMPGPESATTYYVRVRATTGTAVHPGPWSKVVKTGTYRAHPGKPHHKVKVTGGTAAQRKAVKSYLKKWGTHAHITSITIKRNSERLGLSWMNFNNGQTRIILRGSLTGKKLKQVAAHEIAHAKTAWIYQDLSLGTIRESLHARFGKAAGINGAFETMADCVTHQETGSKSHLYYKPNGCTKYQLSWAAKIAKGHRV